MKNRILVTSTLLLCLSLTACGHKHTFADATCTEPMTCTKCEATEGEALGHTWEEATCDTAKTCTVCEATEGEALGHTWVEATCDTAKTCSTCEATEGNPLVHSWIEATTEAPKTCELCGLTDGEPLANEETETEEAEEETTEPTMEEETTETEENQSSFQWPDEETRAWFGTEFNLSEDELNNMTQQRYDSLLQGWLSGEIGNSYNTGGNGGSTSGGSSNTESDDDIPWGEVPQLNPDDGSLPGSMGGDTAGLAPAPLNQGTVGGNM